MKKIIFSLLFLSLYNLIFCQSDTTSIYTDLEVQTTYNVNFQTKKKGLRTLYYVNGEKVKKSKYEQYSDANWNLIRCIPCIVKVHDMDFVLRKEYVGHTDCMVGFYREYYPNGNLKIDGYFKENPTGNWNNIYERGFCSRKDGEWSYFKKNGDLNYTEVWKDGKFIEQIPKQNKVEIHDFAILLNGNPADSMQLTTDDIQNIVLLPLFKNDNTDVDIKVEIEISEIGYKVAKKKISIDKFSEINIESMLSSIEMPESQKLNLTFQFYIDDKYSFRKWLKINE
ncbi:MAG: hypothetical protein AB8G11_24505 [Saprospiraceae bacterium]